MKYVMLIHENPDTRKIFFSEEGKALMAQMDALMAELTASGELIGGEALADPSQAKTVRIVDGAPAVTDGPFAEAKEHLGGYMLLECESIERATEIGMRMPFAGGSGGGLEIRPLMSGSGTEM
jgi:hypothetical protein